MGGLLCGATIFLSAVLLFLVQPILGKIILPWFGGSAGVWATCLVFFQASLLAGYFYAHCLRRYLKPRWQVIVHAALLLASLLLLPIVPSTSWRRAGQTDPAWLILGLLAGTVGVPYLLISSTSPLLQAWYVELKPKASAYRFYALSNLGSLLGLLSFPFWVEPHLTSRTQAVAWSAGYAAFATLCAGTGWYTLRNRPQASEAAQDASKAPSYKTRLLWLGLAACGSGMLLAVSSHISQNVAPIPLLWILPLTIYLLTFVLCFESDRIYLRPVWIPAMLIGLAAMAHAVYADGGSPNLKWAIPTFLAALFSACMVCHGELARTRPGSRWLTEFYLLTSAGGVLGGLFVALLAPRIFSTYAELPILMVACALFATGILWMTASRSLRTAMAAFTIGLCAYVIVHKHRADDGSLVQVRSFYGTLEVDETDDEDEGRVRSLYHGVVEHGAQMLDPKLRREPTGYYVHTSGVGLALRSLEARGPVRVGVIGLGAGVLASYCRAGDSFRFYDINPQVEQVARTQFTFLADCPGTLEVSLGDARLNLEQQAAQELDLLAVDAFSGDAIPVHLLTLEAVREYFRHLKPGGILAVHISNLYLNLAPVVAGIAAQLQKNALQLDDDGDEGSHATTNSWVLVSAAPLQFNVPYAKVPRLDPKVRLWTDDYSNLLQVLIVK
ncbi:MAG TPA: fused MFS/spermidine synthase [Myxococcales bacterium]|nr:fused MFS/spermidine synthase [Myxococcales bacterium]